MIGTLAVDRWTVTFGIAKRGLGGLCPRPDLLLAVPNVKAHPSAASVPTSYYSMWHYNYLCTLKVNIPDFYLWSFHACPEHSYGPYGYSLLKEGRMRVEPEKIPASKQTGSASSTRLFRCRLAVCSMVWYARRCWTWTILRSTDSSLAVTGCPFRSCLAAADWVVSGASAADQHS